MPFWKRASERPVRMDYTRPKTLFDALDVPAPIGPVERLIAQGVDVNARDSLGRTALIVATKKGESGCVKALIAAGAHLNLKDRDGDTALIEAAGSREGIGCLNVLIAAGADLNVKNKDGDTALIIAAEAPRTIDCLKVLIAAGADLNVKGSWGKTALERASMGPYSEIAEILTRAVQARQDRQHQAWTRSAAANLDRWASSDEPEIWVKEHLQGWNHSDWLELLGSLRRSAYWPLEEAKIGRHIEMLRDKFGSQISSRTAESSYDTKYTAALRERKAIPLGIFFFDYKDKKIPNNIDYYDHAKRAVRDRVAERFPYAKASEWQVFSGILWSLYQKQMKDILLSDEWVDVARMDKSLLGALRKEWDREYSIFIVATVSCPFNALTYASEQLKTDRVAGYLGLTTAIVQDLEHTGIICSNLALELGQIK